MLQRHSMPYGSPRRAAFTLIEVLTVAVIISVLVGIMAPAFWRVRMQARTKLCMGNVTALVKAAGVYAVDNNGVFPLNRSDSLTAAAVGNDLGSTGNASGLGMLLDGRAIVNSDGDEKIESYFAGRDLLTVKKLMFCPGADPIWEKRKPELVSAAIIDKTANGNAYTTYAAKFCTFRHDQFLYVAHGARSAVRASPVIVSDYITHFRDPNANYQVSPLDVSALDSQRDQSNQPPHDAEEAVLGFHDGKVDKVNLTDVEMVNGASGNRLDTHVPTGNFWLWTRLRYGGGR